MLRPGAALRPRADSMQVETALVLSYRNGFVRKAASGFRSVAVVLNTLALIAFASCPSQAQTPVDLALVLAVDVSDSMDPDEAELQRQGYVEAFRSPVVHRAILNGALGKIAVSYLEWSGPSDQWVVVPWTLIGTAEQAGAFSERLSSRPTPRAKGGTSISGAIDFSLRLLMDNSFAAVRKVIDISGDGISSHGRPVTKARDEAVGHGITINGLALRLKRSENEGINLEEYYRRSVIGGQGAFSMPVRDREQMAEAIRTKIIREIATAPASLSIMPVPKEARLRCRDGASGFEPIGQGGASTALLRNPACSMTALEPGLCSDETGTVKD